MILFLGHQTLSLTQEYHGSNAVGRIGVATLRLQIDDGAREDFEMYYSVARGTDTFLRNFPQRVCEREVELRAEPCFRRHCPASDLATPISRLEQVAQSHIGKRAGYAMIRVHRIRSVFQGKSCFHHRAACGKRASRGFHISELKIRVPEPTRIVAAAIRLLSGSKQGTVDGGDGCDIGVDRSRPHAEGEEYMRRHVLGVSCVRRDLGVEASRPESQGCVRRVVITVD